MDQEIVELKRRIEALEEEVGRLREKVSDLEGRSPQDTNTGKPSPQPV